MTLEGESAWINRNLCIGLCHVAGILRAQQDPRAALEKFEESLDIARDIVKEFRSEAIQLDYLWCIYRTASCLVELGRSEEARAMLQEACDTATELEPICSVYPDGLEECAAFHETYAKVFAALGRADEAQRRSEHGAAIRARIAALKDRGER